MVLKMKGSAGQFHFPKTIIKLSSRVLFLWKMHTLQKWLREAFMSKKLKKDFQRGPFMHNPQTDFVQPIVPYKCVESKSVLKQKSFNATFVVLFGWLS